MQHFNFSKSTLYNSHHYVYIRTKRDFKNCDPCYRTKSIPNSLHSPLKCFFQYSFWTNSYNPIPLCSDMQTEILLRLDFSVFKLRKMAVHLSKEKMSTRHGHCFSQYKKKREIQSKRLHLCRFNISAQTVKEYPLVKVRASAILEHEKL